MMNKLLILFFLLGTYNSIVFASEELPSDEEILVCQDQAESFGNGKGDDFISSQCMDSFKQMANPNAVVGPTTTKMRVYGFRNMVLIEKATETSLLTNIIAGTSTELKAIRALALDEKNQEVAVLEESGNILFFSSKITGNIAPFRILKHKQLAGASELLLDTVRDQVVIKTNKSILFFSRLANVNARKEKQKLDILKTIDISKMDLKNMIIDPVKSELSAFDNSTNKIVTFDLKK